MMYVTYETDSGYHITIEWHVNDHVREVRNVCARVIEVYADFEEAQYLRDNFVNLLHNRDNGYVQYHGDIAKSIAAMM